MTVFRILKGRGAAGAKELLGEDFPGVGGTDRLATYNWLESQRRQVCWAHLKRDFVVISERAGDSARIAGTAEVDPQYRSSKTTCPRWVQPHQAVSRRQAHPSREAPPFKR